MNREGWRALDKVVPWGQLRCPQASLEGGHGFIAYFNDKSNTIRGWRDRFHVPKRDPEWPPLTPVSFTPGGGSPTSRPRAEEAMIHKGGPSLTPQGTG